MKIFNEDFITTLKTIVIACNGIISNNENGHKIIDIAIPTMPKDDKRQNDGRRLGDDTPLMIKESKPRKPKESKPKESKPRKLTGNVELDDNILKGELLKQFEIIDSNYSKERPLSEIVDFSDCLPAYSKIFENCLKKGIPARGAHNFASKKAYKDDAFIV